VFTARPERIKAVVLVAQTWPRDPDSSETVALPRHLTALLQEEVDRAFAEQEALETSL